MVKSFGCTININNLVLVVHLDVFLLGTKYTKSPPHPLARFAAWLVGGSCIWMTFAGTENHKLLKSLCKENELK